MRLAPGLRALLWHDTLFNKDDWYFLAQGEVDFAGQFSWAHDVLPGSPRGDSVGFPLALPGRGSVGILGFSRGDSGRSLCDNLPLEEVPAFALSVHLHCGRGTAGWLNGCVGFAALSAAEKRLGRSGRSAVSALTFASHSATFRSCFFVDVLPPQADGGAMSKACAAELFFDIASVPAC